VAPSEAPEPIRSIYLKVMEDKRAVLAPSSLRF
jgi:hypothetical protein